LIHWIFVFVFGAAKLASSAGNDLHNQEKYLLATAARPQMTIG